MIEDAIPVDTHGSLNPKNWTIEGIPYRVAIGEREYAELVAGTPWDTFVITRPDRLIEARR